MRGSTTPARSLRPSLTPYRPPANAAAPLSQVEGQPPSAGIPFIGRLENPAWSLPGAPPGVPPDPSFDLRAGAGRTAPTRKTDLRDPVWGPSGTRPQPLDLSPAPGYGSVGAEGKWFRELDTEALVAPACGQATRQRILAQIQFYQVLELAQLGRQSGHLVVRQVQLSQV